jgi:hypothetical protein
VVQDSFLVALDRVAEFDAARACTTCSAASPRTKLARRAAATGSRCSPDQLADSEGEIEAILSRVESEDIPRKSSRRIETACWSSDSSLAPAGLQSALLEKYGRRGASRRGAYERQGFKATESMLHRARLAFRPRFELLAKKSGGLA